MADIDVVPKAKSNVWLWYILAAIVAAVILFMLFGGRSDASRTVGELPDNPTFVVAFSGTA